MDDQRHIQRLGSFEDRVVLLTGERLIGPAAAGAIRVEIEAHETFASPSFHLLCNGAGRAARVLAQHADGGELAGVQLAGAQDQAVIQVRPQAVLFHCAVVRCHGFGTRRGERHIDVALRHQADAICEKPLVLNPWNLDALAEIEKETGRKVYTILQLRLHPAIQELKRQVEASPKDKHFHVDLTYITSRGNWYHRSWKGEESKSGGIATNIGIHFFDMLLWIFGGIKDNQARVVEDDLASGLLELERATVKWSLSINADHLPAEVKQKGKRTYRSLKIEGKETEFSDGFTDLHTKCYEGIMANHGFGIDDARPSVEAVYQLRKSK